MTEREAILVAALRDILRPLARLRREAAARGYVLSGMAADVADSPAYLQEIAREALHACRLVP